MKSSTLNCGTKHALKTTAVAMAAKNLYREVCGKCGAHRIDQQIGLETTLDEYVQTMVEVFRLVRDVLSNDGTLWLNLGDSYAGAGYANHTINGKEWYEQASLDKRRDRQQKLKKANEGLKPKDLCGIPWRVAFALQEDGWYLRQDIIWSKRNPMPESVTDRCTKAHEYLFMLSKSASYYYDADAIREPYNAASLGRYAYAFQSSTSPGRHKPGSKDERFKKSHNHGPNDFGRNRRSVWEINTESYRDAHFATFPTTLVQPCILAGTSERGHCPKCGKGWERITSRNTKQPNVASSALNRFGTGDAGIHRKIGGQYQKWLDANPKATTGWKPTCSCGLDPVPGIVLDPFMGSGTTAKVALSLARRWVGCELNGDYFKMQKHRVGPTWLKDKMIEGKYA